MDLKEHEQVLIYMYCAIIQAITFNQNDTLVSDPLESR